MNSDDLIATEEICIRYQVERTFITTLCERGLIEVVTIEQQEYIPSDKIAEFEKMRRLHYDLEINIEGLEAVQHLLEQLKELQKHNIQLRNRLDLYE